MHLGGVVMEYSGGKSCNSAGFLSKVNGPNHPKGTRGKRQSHHFVTQLPMWTWFSQKVVDIHSNNEHNLSHPLRIRKTLAMTLLNSNHFGSKGCVIIQYQRFRLEVARYSLSTFRWKSLLKFRFLRDFTSSVFVKVQYPAFYLVSSIVPWNMLVSLCKIKTFEWLA